MRDNIRNALVLCAFLISLTACGSEQLPLITTTNTVAPTEEPSETPQPTITITPSLTPLPTITTTPTLAPIGMIKTIPQGIVYLGDENTLSLGFNMNAGGSIGSLLYNGRELVDRTDYGRYIQLSYYDANQKYEPLGSDPFGNFGWNPVQAGSKTRKGAKVLEFRTSEEGIYIKAQGKEWGEDDVDSDVVFETWAWQYDKFFEVHVRSTHIGSDTHASAGQEFPATYFSTSLTKQFSYVGDKPFSAQPVDSLRLLGNYSSCPSVIPGENWVAFANNNGIGLILALPPQPFLSSDWPYCLFSHVSPAVGYAAPVAIFDNPPGAVREAVFYLIPGPIEEGRAIVYDLIPHTTWTFDLNSTEGWHDDSQMESKVENGVLTANLTPNNSLSSASINIPGVIAPTVILTARAIDSETNLCLYFTTTKDPYRNADKSSCVIISTGEFKTYAFDFKDNAIWRDSTITQLGLTTSQSSEVEINFIEVIKNGLAWEFESDGNPEGWVNWNQISSMQVNQGNLQARTTGNDPYLVSSKFAMDSKTFPVIYIRMKVSSGKDAQLFFITSSDKNFDEAKSLRFSINGDGEFHTYTLDMSKVGGWTGTITQIRLDPMEVKGSYEVDFIRIVEQ